MNDTSNVGPTITARKVPYDQRTSILPKYFPHTFIVVENMIYTFMEKFCTKYSGGYWEFYELSNGGFYMALRTEEELEISVPFGNHYEGKIGAEALGIIICLYVYGYMADQYPCTNFPEHYWNLRHFANEHKEVQSIIRTIIRN